MIQQISELLRKIFHTFKALFLSGLFTIIPIAATLFFINFIYGIFSRIIGPLRQVEPSFLQKIPGAEFAIVMLLILATGVILKGFIAHSIVHYFERLVTKIPLVRIVYSSAKIVVDFFKMPDTTPAFKKKVVLIPYPCKGQYHIAFLLESVHDSYEKILPDKAKFYPGERYCKVFMPNSPNVTGGYFFIMTEDEVIPTDITFEEAIKALASCGLVTPESLKRLASKPLP
jgi:uncharacterized membrane protein